MGNLIGGQVWKRLRDENPNVDDQMTSGDFSMILGWLQARIYAQARRYTPKELVRRVVGREMRADEWLDYARAKYTGIYSL